MSGIVPLLMGITDIGKKGEEEVGKTALPVPTTSEIEEELPVSSNPSEVAASTSQASAPVAEVNNGNF